MLGKLVNKFKRQTLQDGGGSDSPPGQSSPNGGRRDGPMRRSARLNEKAEAGPALVGSNGHSSHSPPNTRSRRGPQLSQTADSRKITMSDRRAQTGSAQRNPMVSTAQAAPCDSGTESDDDELEMLDSMSNTSVQSLSHGNGLMLDGEDDECDDGFTGRSPPTLTSSPPLISEIDTSSWDSCGCESGIVLRDSAERDDASRNVDLLEAAFGGGELAIKPKATADEEGALADTAGTTPVQSKDAFPTHFRSMPIDFSALRHSELLLSDPLSGGEDVPTPIGSQKESGRGALLMDAHLAQGHNSPRQSEEGDQPGSHQGAFRRVLRRTRRNSSNNANGVGGVMLAAVAARTVSPPLSVGLGEKRRWGHAPIAEPQHQHKQQLSVLDLSALPIAARTRGSLIGAMLGAASPAAGDASGIAASGNEVPRPVLTAARRTRVRVLYSSQQHQQSPMVANQQQNGRRGQVARALGQSPPALLFVANKRGRHSSKSSNSPQRPSLNFDKMRKRMLNGGGGVNGAPSGGDGAGTAGDD